MPDFVVRDAADKDCLMDVKTMGLCTSWFPETVLARAVRGEVMQRRAARVHHDYVKKARDLDRDCCQTRPGTVGPVEQRLASFGTVQALIFGPFGEVSAGVRKLVAHIANSTVQHSRDMVNLGAPGARTHEQAKAALKSRFRRELAFCNMREQIRLKLRRLDLYVRGTDSPSTTSAARLRSQAAEHAARDAAYEAGMGLTGYAGWQHSLDSDD